ncbi:hypothetical protein CEXT_531671 [Caerostris extrusa]|uniref:Uncharacterized protein n=1 Tax=Caerostris extrusa TaxID=172846 RepID=A0AAV4W135_CAEEX|nr:hypothetical protein CEXT_531671 [Caerostris extrusa]
MRHDPTRIVTIQSMPLPSLLYRSPLRRRIDSSQQTTEAQPCVVLLFGSKGLGICHRPVHDLGNMAFLILTACHLFLVIASAGLQPPVLHAKNFEAAFQGKTPSLTCIKGVEMHPQLFTCLIYSLTIIP